VAVGPVVAALNRREAAMLRRRQRRYFDGREKQLRRRMALAAHKPWRETSRGFHLTAAVCGGVCTAGLTAAALLITFSGFLGRGDSELGYSLVVLLVWPALVVCIGAKVLGCGVTRSWHDGIPLAVGAYVWSVSIFTLGALLVAVVNESHQPLISTLYFGVGCASVGAALSLLPCFVAVTCYAYVDDPRRARANAILLHIRRKLP
jgi:hypothetical protein